MEHTSICMAKVFISTEFVCFEASFCKIRLENLSPLLGLFKLLYIQVIYSNILNNANVKLVPCVYYLVEKEITKFYHKKEKFFTYEKGRGSEFCLWGTFVD